MARLPTPQPQGQRGSWFQSSHLLTTHLRSPKGVGQKTHAQSHFKRQSPDVHGLRDLFFSILPPHPAILVQSRGGCQGPDLQNLQGLLLGPQVVPPAPQGLLPGVQTGVSVQERWPGCLCMSLPPVMETLVFWPGGFGRVPSGAGYQKDSGCEPAWCAIPAQSPRVHPRPIQRCQEGQHQQQRSAWQDARSLGAHTRGKCRQGGKLDTQPPVTQPGQKRSQDPIT